MNKELPDWKLEQEYLNRELGRRVCAFDIHLLSPLFGGGEIRARLKSGLWELLKDLPEQVGKEHHEDKPATLEEAFSLELLDEKVIATRAYNVLKKKGISTIPELAEHSARSLLYLTGFGWKSLRYIQKILRIYGFSLKEGYEEASEHTI